MTDEAEARRAKLLLRADDLLTECVEEIKRLAIENEALRNEVARLEALLSAGDDHRLD